ncbi:MAG: hypothetical protein JSW43_10735 [Gemmatimonadota bacterium]|nr:MAG: hypothetical protein JSW43_10735 [Gemmatimonadota bacterium]
MQSRLSTLPLVSAALAALFVLSACDLVAQERFDFYGRGPYRSEVPRPSDLLGYDAGARQTQYAEQQAVLDALVAAAPERARTEVIGTTEEGRTMRVLLISSPENLVRLDEIQADVERLADPRTTSPEQAQAIVTRDPVVVMLSYSIHGNEPAGFEAAMWVAYQLLASEEPGTVDLLQNTLVVLNPSANPDGHERFAVWYNSLAMGTDEPYTHEWNEPWDIWGRYGHYRFDMNRDFFALSQAPTRAIVETIMRWHPQVYVDFHSTTEQFFFPPPAQPVNRNLPAESGRWMETFGRGNAAAFDRFGWQYYTRDVFDLFYAGYFDTGPSLHGATGMTYETDGGKALKRRRDDGTVITFAEGIAHNYVASLATIETAAQNRQARLGDFYDFHRFAIAEARSATMKRVVILPDNDHTNAARLATLLLRQHVEVARLDEPYTASAAHHYLAGPNGGGERRTFPAGALVVDLAQPEGRMARALLEPRTEMDGAFVQRQLEKYQRNRRRGSGATSERYEFYDITAWSLPLTLGLEAYWTEDLSNVRATPLALPADADPVRALAPAGSVTGLGRSAYVFPNDRQAAAQLAMALLREGFVVNVSREPLRADGRGFPRGTFVVRTTRNPESLHDRLASLASEIGVPVTAVQSAFPDTGPVGVGSQSVDPVFAPRIAVATGGGISITSYGALWHFLEAELKQPFVPVPLDWVGQMYTLTDYNVFIIPSGSPSTMRRELGPGGIERLKQWVRDGGVLIAYDNAALLPGHEDVGLSSVKELDPDASGDSLSSGPELTPPLASPSAEPNRSEYVPGSIFRATLDQTHWLTMGYRQSALPVMLRGGTFLAPSEDGDNPVVFVGDSLLLAGFAWPDNTERLLKETVYATAERAGRGHVVLLAEDPLYRAFWRGPARLLTNAILFGARR